MCTGLKGLQLLFDAAVRQRRMGQDLPGDVQVARASSLGVRAVCQRSCKRSAIIEFDLMKAMPNLGYCLPEDNARELNSLLGKMPGEFL